MIKIGIAGHGNLGRGVELAVAAARDMELCAIFTRRDPKTLTPLTQGAAVLPMSEAEGWKGKLDVLILCGGSATDLPEQGPSLAAIFNTVDSFDNHAEIPRYLAAMNKAAVDTTAVISVGWDPGLFSMMRALSGAVLPDGHVNTFWGCGVSQGHSQAIREISGVKNAVQYTVPVGAAIEEARNGVSLPAAERHIRECYVAAEEGADCDGIARKIKEMPNYFAGYDTRVHFISEEELRENHSKMPHGGFVIHTGATGGTHKQVLEFSLKLESNPEFTASVLAAYARAAARLAAEKQYGAKTVLDIPLTYISPTERNTLIQELL
jgi:diaminopimelate dehydrogenase